MQVLRISLCGSCTCKYVLYEPIHKLIALTAGYEVGILGATHVSIEDVVLMRALPNITVISLADCVEIIKAILVAPKTADLTY